uniref:Snake toxin/toxin-like domain-containing protein n=1 Tax=Pavo cristatus TaxID=9049 RepID=A0A8C9F6M2_PAVCR
QVPSHGNLGMHNCCLPQHIKCPTRKQLIFRVIGSISIISKGCDASCQEDYQDFKVGNRNVSCCITTQDKSSAHLPCSMCIWSLIHFPTAVGSLGWWAGLVTVR